MAYHAMPARIDRPVPASGAPRRRHTRQRDAVLRAVHSSANHPDVRWVHEAVRRELPAISLATVYRNLDVLVGSGELNEVRLASGQVRFDRNTSEHGHLICRKCGSIRDIDVAAVEGRMRRCYRSAGYEDLTVTIDVYGVCPDCAASDSPPGAGAVAAER